MVEAGMHSEGLRGGDFSSVKLGLGGRPSGPSRLTAAIPDVRTGQARGGRLIRRSGARAGRRMPSRRRHFRIIRVAMDICRI